MKVFPVYKPNEENSIYAVIHQWDSGDMWDWVEEKLVDPEQTGATLSKEVSFDSIAKRYVLTVPSKLPDEKEYDVIFYKDAELTQIHLGRRVYKDTAKGFIECNPTHIPSWI